MRVVLVLASMVVPLFLARAAWGVDADDLIRRGVERRRKGDDAGALRLFQQAYDQAAIPRAAAQLGLAEQALGKWVAADWHLREALAHNDDPWIEKNRATLAQAGSRVAQHVGLIEIVGGWPGAEVRIDGVTRTTLPLRSPLATTIGGLEIELVGAGHLPLHRTTIVHAHEITREFFDASPLSGTPPRGAESSGAALAQSTRIREASPGPAIPSPTSSPGSGTEGGPVTGISAAVAPDERSDKGGSSGRLIAVLATGGLSAAALVVGVSEHRIWYSKIDTFEHTAGCDPKISDLGGSRCAGIYNSGRSAETRAFIGYGAAGALALTSAILFFTMDHHTGAQAVACSTTAPFSRGMACAFRF